MDTNVLLVANQKASQASPRCVAACARRLRDLRDVGVIVLDDGLHILREYRRNLSSSGQPGVGDSFFKWVLTNQANATRCEQVAITPVGGSQTEFAEFPSDLRLQLFDPSDRKFVAVARAHPLHPPILNAVDSDWWEYEAVLAEHGITVQQLCPEQMPVGAPRQ